MVGYASGSLRLPAIRGMKRSGLPRMGLPVARALALAMPKKISS